MKPLLKATLLVLAASLAGVSAAAAGETRLVRIEHGRTVSYALRPMERQTTTIAFAARGTGVGQYRMQAESSATDLKITRRDAPNGPDVYYYRPAQ
jgi:hypothetical protein